LKKEGKNQATGAFTGMSLTAIEASAIRAASSTMEAPAHCRAATNSAGALTASTHCSRPWASHFGFHSRFAAQIRRRLTGLLQRIRHTLQAHLLQAVARHRTACAVSNGMNMRVRRPALFVHHNAIAAGQASGLRKRILAQRPNADHGHIARKTASVRKPNAGQAAVLRIEGTDGGAQHQLHPLLAMPAFEKGRERLTGHARKQSGLTLDHRHLGAQRAGRCSPLQPHITAAHNRQPHALADAGLDRFSIGSGAQLEHALAAYARDIGLAQARAGGNDQLLIRKRFTVLKRHSAGGRINATHTRGHAQRH